jgi:hypothetical protein
LLIKLSRLSIIALLLLASPIRSDEAPGDASTDASDQAAAADDTTATAIEVTGTVVYEAEEGVFKPVAMGQLFGEGDHVLTRENSGLHLVLADGSSITLGPNSELTLSKIGSGKEGSQTFLELLKGTANAIVQKLKLGSSFEMKTPNAVAAVKGTEFEVSEDGSAGTVSVREGIVAMSDSQGGNTVQIPPMSRAQAGAGRVPRPFRMSERQYRDFDHRWAHAREIHGRRLEIMRPFAARMHERRAELMRRRPLLRQRLQRRMGERGRGPLGRAALRSRRQGREGESGRGERMAPRQRRPAARDSRNPRGAEGPRSKPKKENDKRDHKDK